MDLKQRKRINNGLPGFENGTSYFDRLPSKITSRINGIANTLGNQLYNQKKQPWELPGTDKWPEATGQEFENFLQSQGQPKKWYDVQIVQKTDNTVPIVNNKSGGILGDIGTIASKASPWIAAMTKFTSDSLDVKNHLKSAEDIQQETPIVNGNIGGAGYQKYANVSVDKISKDFNNEAWSLMASNPITSIGMFFNKGDQLRWAKQAAKNMNSINAYNRSGALGMSLRQKEALNDIPDGGTLYAANGKDVHTAQGYSAIAPNARVEGQEVIRDPYTESSHIVPGPANGDNNYANLKPSDIVYTDKFGISKIAQQAVKAQQAAQKDMKTRGPIGRATAQLAQAEATKVLDELAQTQAQLRQVGLLGEEQYAAAKNGKDKLPGFKLGWNWWVDGLGALTGLGQAFGSALQKVKTPTSYRTNPYEKQALSTLAGLRINPYSIYRDMLNQQRYAQYNLNNAGGLSGSQKALANVGLATGLMNTYGKLNQDIQEQNNKYHSDYATKLLATGDADRQQLIKSNAYDLDYYSKAHAAKQKMVETGIKNWLAALQQGVANQFKLYNANKTINRYDSEYNF